jgi:hypothetical protein
MKVSGFTFIRNAIKYDFPILEAITSILPIVDEFIVNVGQSEDDTLGLIRSIKDERIKIVESVWDETMKKDGQVLGVQQDIALSQCTGDWAFLLQGDEVVHEDDLEIIRSAMERYLGQRHILGLIFRMVHFKGDYWSVDPWMYRKATRIIRNNGQIHSTPDCCDFRTIDSPKMIKSGPQGKLITARLFHYGWAKDAQGLREKNRQMATWWHGETLTEQEMDKQAAIVAELPKYDILKEFRKSHPKVMHERIHGTRHLRRRLNRWLNWRFYREVVLAGFKG